MSCCEVEDETFLFANLRLEFISIQQQEGFHGSMPHSFISVDERVIEHEREAEGCGFGWEIRIEVIPPNFDAVERGQIQGR